MTYDFVKAWSDLAYQLFRVLNKFLNFSATVYAMYNKFPSESPPY